MKQMDMFSATEGRDQGLERVMENAGMWGVRAKAIIYNLDFDGTITGEKIKHIVTDHIGPPHHCNAWGALIRWSIIQKIIAKTGDTAKMQDPQSHARENPTYVKGSAARCPKS